MAIIVIPTDYPTIQEGVDNSTSGDTIEVLPGTYQENVVVNVDDISIFGDAKGMTILEGSGIGTGIAINSNDLIVRDIIFQNYEYGLILSGNTTNITQCKFHNNLEAGMSLQGDENIINYNTFEDNEKGMLVEGSTGLIRNNDFYNNTKYGIQNSGDPVIDTDISNNTIQCSGIGFYVGQLNSTGNQIYRNIINKCDYAMIMKGNRNEIYFNTFSDSTIAGLSCSGQSNIYNKNEIVKNTVGIIGMEPSAEITYNIITLSGSYGVNLLNESGVIFKNNIITSNKNGITQNSSPQILSQNIIRDNCDDVPARTNTCSCGKGTNFTCNYSACACPSC